MKIKQFNLLALAVATTLVVTSCGGSSSKETTEEGTLTDSIQKSDVSATFVVDTEESVVAWKGEVAGVYGHNGVINIKEGSIAVEARKIVGGEVVIDMASIQPLDSASYEASGKTPQDLVDHLSAADFFLVEEFPTASFVIKSHTEGQLIGDLTIRGKTNEEIVTLSSLEITENGLKGEGKLVFDRQKYDVKWEHYIKDYVLSNDIEITLTIVAANQVL